MSWAERLSIPDVGVWDVLPGTAGILTVGIAFGCCIEGGVECGQSGGELGNYTF